MTQIHESAVVHPSAQLDEDVWVGPGAVIGPHVQVASGTRIGAYVVLDGHMRIGRNNRICPHAVLGTPPQDVKYADEPTRVEIGDDNRIREFVTIHRGTPQGRAVTSIGSGVFLMAYSHVAHDNIIEDHVIVANLVQLAGHVHIMAHAIVGGASAVHQFVRIGTSAFVGGGSMVEMDVPPFCRATGNRARLHGLNSIGLKRRGFSPQQLKAVRQAYRWAFSGKMLNAEAAQRIDEELLQDCPELAGFSEFLRSSRRGITRAII